jgi:hypothetical protein
MVIEIARQKKSEKKSVFQEVHEMLAKENACYVLITCGEPAEDGKMQVEMTYEGDASLASFLVDSAQEIIGNQEICPEP